jgi:hypothetical protein
MGTTGNSHPWAHIYACRLCVQLFIYLAHCRIIIPFCAVCVKRKPAEGMGGVAYTSSNRTQVIWITPQRQVTIINGDYHVLSVVTSRFNNSTPTGTSIRILHDGIIGQIHTPAVLPLLTISLSEINPANTKTLQRLDKPTWRLKWDFIVSVNRSFVTTKLLRKNKLCSNESIVRCSQMYAESNSIQHTVVPNG